MTEDAETPRSPTRRDWIVGTGTLLLTAATSTGPASAAGLLAEAPVEPPPFRPGPTFQQLYLDK